jgi:predicted transposase YdaD
MPKVSKISLAAIEVMFSVSELKQTRVYRDAMEEGRVEGRTEGRPEEARSLVLRQLIRRLGAIIPSTAETQIRSLSNATGGFGRGVVRFYGSG